MGTVIPKGTVTTCGCERQDLVLPAPTQGTNRLAWVHSRNWMQHTPNRSKPSMKCRVWLPNRPQKMRRLSIRNPVILITFQPRPRRTTDHPLGVQICSLDAKHGVHSVAEQLMAAGATDEEVKKTSQIMAQTVRKLEGESTIPEPGSKCPNRRVVWWYGRRAPFVHTSIQQHGYRTKAKKPSRGVCRTQPQKRDAEQRSASKKKMSKNLLCQWFWSLRHHRILHLHLLPSWMMNLGSEQSATTRDMVVIRVSIMRSRPPWSDSQIQSTARKEREPTPSHFDPRWIRENDPLLGSPPKPLQW